MNGPRPLANCRILVTRPRHQSAEFCELLRQEDAVPIAKPLIEIAPPADFSDLDEALRAISSYHWVIFASVNAVRALFNRTDELGLQLNWGDTKIAAIGTQTAAVLQEHRLQPQYVPTSFVAESFVEGFPGYPSELQNTRVLWPKTNIGRTYIADRFAEAGARVTKVICYTTGLPENSESLGQELRRLLETGGIDAVTFTSSQTVRNFAALLGFDEGVSERVMSNVLVGVIGPETAATAGKLLPRVDVVAREHTILGLISALKSFVQTNNLTFPRIPGDN